MKNSFANTSKNEKDGTANVLAGLLPQLHAAPLTALFSVAARSQVQAPAGRAPRYLETCQHINVFHHGTLARLFDLQKRECVLMLMLKDGRNEQEGKISRHLRHEHRAPWTTFSVADRAQSQLKAVFLPQEHLACEAQTQFAEPDLPQQEVVWVIVSENVDNRSSKQRGGARDPEAKL